MGIIRVIKQNELQGGASDEHIYPVTSTEAVYDADNTKISVSFAKIKGDVTDLSDLVEKVRGTINNLLDLVVEYEENLNEFQLDYNNFVLRITDQIEGIESPSISFKGTISGTTTANRGTTNANNHNIECSNSFNTPNGKCEVLDLDNVKPGDAFFITEAGDYTIKNTTYTVSNLSILQCVQSDDGNSTFNVYDLNIPFIPKPTSADAGKSLKVADNLTLYWG